MNKKLLWGIMFLSVFALIQCKSDNRKTVVLQGGTQGTYYRITYVTDKDLDVERVVDSVLNIIDLNFNLWNKESLIVKLNDGDTTVVISPMFVDLFEKSQFVSAATDGAFDISVGALTDAWGFGTDSLKRQNIKALKRSIGYDKIRIEDGRFYRQNDSIRLTMNAIAQGYTVDVLREVFDDMGLDSYLIDIGGELFGRGVKADGSKWKVGIESPAENKDAEQKIGGLVELENMAIVTSGDYRKYVELDGVRYSHTIDPKTQQPISNKMLSATVYTKDATDADAYATAFMVMGVERAMAFLANHEEMKAFFIYADNEGKVRTAGNLDNLIKNSDSE